MHSSSSYDYDAIVIGSGFGGSVSALRLSEKGYKVAVLEKGKRWKTEDFPKTNWNIRKYLWLPVIGCYGYQMITQLKHALIFHGGGVGGGSLVYANQLLVPPDNVFERPEWGPGNWKEKLMPMYKKARMMLGANESPQIGEADKRLREVGIEMTGKDTFLPEAAIPKIIANCTLVIIQIAIPLYLFCTFNKMFLAMDQVMVESQWPPIFPTAPVWIKFETKKLLPLFTCTMIKIPLFIENCS